MYLQICNKYQSILPSVSKGANQKFSVGLWGVGDLIFNNKPLIKSANSVIYNSILMVLSCFWLPTTLILPILLKVYYWKSNHPNLITLQRIFGLLPIWLYISSSVIWFKRLHVYSIMFSPPPLYHICQLH